MRTTQLSKRILILTYTNQKVESDEEKSKIFEAILEETFSSNLTSHNSDHHGFEVKAD